MAEISVRNTDRLMLVDDDDYERLNALNWSWNGEEIRSTSRIKEYNTCVRPQQLVMRVAPKCGLVVDHLYGDKFDNRKASLEVKPSWLNSQNRHYDKPDATSKYRGVSWNKHKKKWVARFNLAGNSYDLGAYDDEVYASKVWECHDRRYKPLNGGWRWTEAELDDIPLRAIDIKPHKKKASGK